MFPCHSLLCLQPNVAVNTAGCQDECPVYPAVWLNLRQKRQIQCLLTVTWCLVRFRTTQALWHTVHIYSGRYTPPNLFLAPIYLRLHGHFFVFPPRSFGSQIDGRLLYVVYRLYFYYLLCLTHSTIYPRPHHDPVCNPDTTEVGVRERTQKC